MKKVFAKASVILLIMIAFFAFPGFGWRHGLLLVTQLIVAFL